MELKEFIGKVISDIAEAVDSYCEGSNKDIYLAINKGKDRTIEFDIATSAENINAKTGKAGVKVLEYVEFGGNIEKESKNSTVTRIKFGVNISTHTKEEADKIRAKKNNELLSQNTNNK